MTSEKQYSMRLAEFADLNPLRPLKKGAIAKLIDMAALPTSHRSIELSSIEKRPYSSGARFKNGDSLLARITPCLENGKSAFVNCLQKDEVAAGSTEFIVIAAKRQIEADFVYYASRLPEFRQYAISRMEGTSGRQRVSHHSIADFEFPFVEPEDRVVIGKMLRSLDDCIDNNRALAANLEAIARRLFKSWFVDFDPVHAKAAGEKPIGLADDISALFPNRFEESKSGDVPEGWKVGIISDFSTNVRIGCTPSQFSAEDFYVGLEHFDRHCLTLWNGGSGDDATSNKSRFSKGDLLFGKLRPYFHKVAIAPMDGICSTDVLVIRCADKAYREFMYFTLFQDDVIQFVSDASGGTRMPRTNWETLAGYDCVVPPKPLSSAFGKIVEPMIETMMQCVSENNALTKLRDLLLPRLISGKLRVEDAESVIEEAIA
jgi:type I restriction enzyme S subunit